MKNQEITTPIFTDIQKTEKTQTDKNRENIYNRIFGSNKQVEIVRTDLIEYIDRFIGYHENVDNVAISRLKEIVSKHMLERIIYQAVGMKPTDINIDDASIKFKVKEYDYWYYLTISRIPE